MGATWLVYLRNQRGSSEIQERLVFMGGKAEVKFSVICKLYRDNPTKAPTPTPPQQQPGGNPSALNNPSSASTPTSASASGSLGNPSSAASAAGNGAVKGPTQAKSVYLIHHSKEIGRQYSLVEETFTEADGNLEALLYKLKQYQVRQTLNIEGWEYSFGDFVIRTGNVQVGTTSKGVMIEVEYRPCSKPETSEIAKEFLQFCSPAHLASQMEPAELPDFSLTDLAFPFTTGHTAFQYLSLFRKEDLL